MEATRNDLMVAYIDALASIILVGGSTDDPDRAQRWAEEVLVRHLMWATTRVREQVGPARLQHATEEEVVVWVAHTTATTIIADRDAMPSPMDGNAWRMLYRAPR